MYDISRYKLIVGKTPTYNERRAAVFIAEKIKIVTGFAIEMLTDVAPVGGYEIIVGTSVVLKLHYNREQTILFFTDAEASCSIDLLKNHRDQLKCDVLLLGHHGGQSVSRECYAETGARISITPQGAHGWFCDGGEAPSQTELGIRRSLTYMCEQGISPENIYCDMFGTLSFELPIKIK